MSSSRFEEIKTHFATISTDELRKIVHEQNTELHSAEGILAAQEILMERDTTPSTVDSNRPDGNKNADNVPETVLSQILHLQKKQQLALADIQKKVGCLFTYMIVTLALGILAALFSLISR